MTCAELFFAALWSFGASACCSLYLNTTLRLIPWGGFLGLVGWLIYKLFVFYVGSKVGGYLLGAFAVALLSEFLAVFLRNPATVFLLPGLLPLVPGGGIFSMMRAAVLEDFTVAAKTGYDTLAAAAAIALGVAVASSFARITHSALHKRHNQLHG